MHAIERGRVEFSVRVGFQKPSIHGAAMEGGGRETQEQLPK